MVRQNELTKEHLKHRLIVPLVKRVDDPAETAERVATRSFSDNDVPRSLGARQSVLNKSDGEQATFLWSGQLTFEARKRKGERGQRQATTHGA